MKILLNSQSGIGINILAVPTLRAIKRNYPDSYVHLIVRFETGRDLLHGCPFCDEISVVNYSMLRKPASLYKYMRDLRKVEYDYSFMMFPGNRLDKNLFHFLAKTRNRVSHKYLYRRNMNMNFINDIQIDIDYSAHDVEQNMNLLRVIGIDTKNESKKLELFLHDYAHKNADDIVRRISGGKKLIGMHPGSSKDLTMDMKRWPSEYFARIADLLKEKYGCEILIFGSREEEGIKNRISDLMELDCEIVEEMDIQTTAALIQRCSLFLSNDSGLMHISAALGVKTVGIFGPTDPVRTAPYGEGNVVVRSDKPCISCFSIYSVGKKIRCDKEERECLIDLTPERIMDEIGDELDKVLKVETETNVSHQ